MIKMLTIEKPAKNSLLHFKGAIIEARAIELAKEINAELY